MNTQLNIEIEEAMNGYVLKVWWGRSKIRIYLCKDIKQTLEGIEKELNH